MTPDARVQEAMRALDFIERRGYRRCDIPACNCGSWHGGNAEERLRDFHEELVNADVETNGKTLIGALREVLSERASLMAETERLRSALREARTLAQSIIGHEIESLSCDRDGETYCGCVRETATALLTTIDSLLTPTRDPQ